jgi:hypothetical protein
MEAIPASRTDLTKMLTCQQLYVAPLIDGQGQINLRDTTTDTAKISDGACHAFITLP